MRYLMLIGSLVFFGTSFAIAGLALLPRATAPLMGTPTSATIHGIPVLSVYDGCADCAAFAKQIAWSIDHDPNSWAVDSEICHFTHKSVDLWIGNGASMVNFHGAINNPPWLVQEGQVRLDPTPEQALIWRAFVRWRLRQPPAEPKL